MNILFLYWKAQLFSAKIAKLKLPSNINHTDPNVGQSIQSCKAWYLFGKNATAMQNNKPNVGETDTVKSSNKSQFKQISGKIMY